MSGDGGDISGALGDLATGALAARAVEPKAGEGAVDATGHTTENACLNCGTVLVGAFCTACGQKAHVHRSLAAIGHDILHGVLHLDGKLWHTLPLLALKPGELTRRYIDGQRARFVSPMAMFLFSVFLMFAVFQAVGLTTPTDLSSAGGLSRGVGMAEENLQAERSKLEERLKSLEANDPEKLRLENSLRETDEGLAALRTAADMARDEDIEANINFTGIEAIDRGLIKKWRENPGLMLYKLQANSYKFSWLLIPLSIPFVWVLFLWRRRFAAYDHAIFVTYSLAFMSLLFITLSILFKIGVSGGWLFAAISLIPPIHIYKQLRGTYELSRFSAFWRLMALSLFIWIIVVLFLQTLLLLGAF